MQLNIPLTPAGLRTLLVSLLGFELFLTLFHLLIQFTEASLPWGPIRLLFDLDEDRSVPSWFSAVQLFAISAVMLQMALSNRRPHEVPPWLMALGAAVFLMLSMDEGASVHERFSGAARRLEADWLLFGEGRGAWILPYLAFVTVSVLVLWRPLMGVAARYRREAAIGAGGAVMIGIGAAAFELVSYYTLPDTRGAWYQMEVAGEELLEMSGATFILYAALSLAGKLSLPGGSAAPAAR